MGSIRFSTVALGLSLLIGCSGSGGVGGVTDGGVEGDRDAAVRRSDGSVAEGTPCSTDADCAVGQVCDPCKGGLRSPAACTRIPVCGFDPVDGPNDCNQAATQVVLPAVLSDRHVCGNIFGAGPSTGNYADLDSYQFTLDHQAAWEIRLTASSKDVQLLVTCSTLSCTGGRDEYYELDKRLFNVRAEPATYTVVVNTRSDETATYTLSIRERARCSADTDCGAGEYCYSPAQCGINPNYPLGLCMPPCTVDADCNRFDVCSPSTHRCGPPGCS